MYNLSRVQLKIVGPRIQNTLPMCMIKLCVCVCLFRPVALSHVNADVSFTAQQAVNGLLNFLWKTEKGSKFPTTQLLL